MLRTKYLTLAGCAVAALAFAGTTPALAASTMCSDGMMASSDAMMDEEHMSDDSMMEGDDMMEEDSMMSDDDMAHDDSMGDDSMMSEDDSMMEEDSMMSEDDAMMEEESMMAEDDAMGDEMAHDDGMMAEGVVDGQYTVQVGDSLFEIAENYLCDGDRFPEIIAANQDVLGDATMLQPGMVLTIPGD